jgi:glycosyltransferase involved in cell wall biosynthesis
LAPQGPACPTMLKTPAEPLKVSIIMPTYRRPHTILRAVATIQAQTHDNWELIIVDNAGDGDYHFTDPRIRIYRYTDRPSASAARNYGLQFATGDLVCFFDDDDEMFPHYLARFVAAFATSPRTNMVRCGMLVCDGRVNFSFATPECCLRRQFAAPTWTDGHPAHDQQYFLNIMSANQWSETRGDIIVIPEPLCRANADRRGGLRAGAL